MKSARILVVLALAVSLFSACAHYGDATIALSPVAPVFDRILKKGELVVGTAGSMPPFNMTTMEGKVIGFEVDLAGYLADAMGVQLKLEVMPFSDLLPALEAGKVHMVLSSMTITPERNLRVAFVGPYLISGKAILTRMEAIASIKDFSEIDDADITLTAIEGSTSQAFVEKALAKAKLVTTKDYDEAVQMVIQGKAHAMVADYPICVLSVFRYPDKGLLTVVDPFTYEPIGIAVPPNDPLLVNWLENFLDTLEGSGELEKLKQDWLEDGSWIKELR